MSGSSIAPAAIARAAPGIARADLERATPEGLKDAFEALLVGELLTPLEDSLRRSGLFPDGSAGDIYAYFWKQHMSNLLAGAIDLLPGWNAPAAKAGDTPPSAPSSPAAASSASLPVRLPARRHDGGAATMASEAAAGPLSRLAPFEAAIHQAARAAEISVNWVRAVIIQESGGKTDALSPKGAQGLMQLIPTTADALGVKNPFDPTENIQAGTRYLGGLLRRFGDMRLALAAYNAGPARVAAYGGLPPFRETQEYVARVVQLKELFDRSAGVPR